MAYMYKDSVMNRFYVHRLVAINFISNPDNLPQVNLINGIKTDNRVENLEWCDAYKNMQHASATGLLKMKGEKHSKSKLKDSDITFIRLAFLNKTHSSKQLSEMFNVCIPHLHLIKNRKFWKHVL